MAVTNFIVSSLPAYVQENRDLLIKNFALVGEGTRRRISIQSGVKGKAAINFLALDATLQDGASCAFDPLDSLTLTQRYIETAPIKMDGQVCPRTLLQTYAEYLVRVNATEEDLSFEGYIIECIVNEVNKKIEKLIWQGDTSSLDADLKWIDGFVTIAAAEVLLGTTTAVSINAGTSAYDGILAVYAAMDEEALERGGEIYVSPEIFRAFVQDLVNRNFYHYGGPQEANPGEFFFPGTDCKVVKTYGLKGNLNILGTFAKNLFYGCDVEGDSEDIDIWYSKDTRMVRYEVLWNSGAQIAFPEHAVLGTFAAAPSVGGNAVLAALADIAGNTAELADADHVFKTKEQA